MPSNCGALSFPVEHAVADVIAVDHIFFRVTALAKDRKQRHIAAGMLQLFHSFFRLSMCSERRDHTVGVTFRLRIGCHFYLDTILV